MKNMTRVLLIFTIIIIGHTITLAQTYEEYVKSENDKLNKFKNEQEKGLEKLQAEYNNYVEQADKEFSEFLKTSWVEYDAKQTEHIPESPKPVLVPKRDTQSDIKSIEPKQIALILPEKDKKALFVKPLLPIIQKTEIDDYLKQTINVDYYGRQLVFFVDKKLAKIGINEINEQALAKWWSQASETNYNSLVNELLRTKNILNLNDWAYYMLISKTAAQMSMDNKNNTRLFSWFLMIRSGYKAKIAFSGNEIFLLLPSESKLYGKTFFTINNERYYVIGEKVSHKLFTYDFNFPGANRIIDYNIYTPMNIGEDSFEKEISFIYKGKSFSFPVKLNVHTLYMMKDYPVTELSVFFNAAMSEISKQSLAEGLMPYISGVNDKEALNFLLAFVQKAFDYKTDQEQFNKEKFFFPEELFFYPASDCEDRSALYIYLVKQLLHLPVVGLKYDGHAAVAVKINEEIDGDYVLYNNDKYMITDPTYVNAPMGLSMPKFKNKNYGSNCNYRCKF